MEELYHNLEMWQRANSICLKVFKLSNDLPSKERLSLFHLIRNTSENIPLKIVNGSTSKHINEYIEKLKEAYDLLIKLKTEILISKHLQYITTKDLKALDVELNELIKLLYSMINSLKLKMYALNYSFAYCSPPFGLN